MPPAVGVLVIAGADSSGGAGIAADLAAITALGARAALAVTAVTVQDRGHGEGGAVHAIHLIPPDLVASQVASALADPGMRAIKTGMLASAETVAAVHAVIAGQGRDLPLVIDPVLAATSGARLLPRDAEAPLRALFRRATVITPNCQEAAQLTGMPVANLEQMRAAAQALHAAGAKAVLLKGGHADGTEITDLLLTDSGETLYPHPRLPGSRRGTGCTLSAALATLLAQSHPLPAATRSAIAHTTTLWLGGDRTCDESLNRHG